MTRLLLSILVLTLLACPSLGYAQESTPAAAAWVGKEPDLAAMPITPGDLAAMGRPGYGRFWNGYFHSLASYSDLLANYYGYSVEETRDMLARSGVSRVFTSAMGLPSAPDGSESPPVRGAYATVIELQSAAEADSFFDYVESNKQEGDGQFSVGDAPFALGDRAIIVNYSQVDPESGDSYVEDFVIFQSGNLLVDTGFFANFAAETATPAATPVVTSGLAATAAELEVLGRRQLERVETVLADGSPDLPHLLLRMGDDPLDATVDYSEGYRLLDGELMPYYASRDDDMIADPAALTGAIAAYELTEAFQPDEEPGPGDHYFLNRLYAFPDEDAADAFLASRPEVLSAGGFALVSDATSETRSTLLPDQATDLGDESLAFSFLRSFADGGKFEGYEVFVRVGTIVAAVSVEGPPDMPLAQVTEIAAAQAACLAAGECPAALPVPAAFLAAPAMATPAA